MVKSLSAVLWPEADLRHDRARLGPRVHEGTTGGSALSFVAGDLIWGAKIISPAALTVRRLLNFY